MKHVLFAFVAVGLVGCGAEELIPGTPDAGGGGVQATFSSLYGDYFSNCGQCHSPNGPGRTSDIEQSLDFSTKSTAYTTITSGSATGLMGNPMGCNGTPFIVSGQPSQSLIVAVLDDGVRATFDLAGHPDCDMNSITDQTTPKVGSSPSAAFLAALKTWIQNGAPNN